MQLLESIASTNVFLLQAQSHYHNQNSILHWLPWSSLPLLCPPDAACTIIFEKQTTTREKKK